MIFKNQIDIFMLIRRLGIRKL